MSTRDGVAPLTPEEVDDLADGLEPDEDAGDYPCVSNSMAQRLIATVRAARAERDGAITGAGVVAEADYNAGRAAAFEEAAKLAIRTRDEYLKIKHDTRGMQERQFWSGGAESSQSIANAIRARIKAPADGKTGG